jgi:hypothetical protein
MGRGGAGRGLGEGTGGVPLGEGLGRWGELIIIIIIIIITIIPIYELIWAEGGLEKARAVLLLASGGPGSMG